MKSWLVDTGPLVAFLDAGDPAHARVATALASLRGRLLTTAPVLTEAFYLLRSAAAGPERLVEFLETTAAEIVDVFEMHQLRRMTVLMQKYRDTPMDFADASLVVVAEQRDHDGILTLDERGFRAFRFQGNRRFRLEIQDG